MLLSLAACGGGGGGGGSDDDSGSNGNAPDPITLRYAFVVNDSGAVSRYAVDRDSGFLHYVGMTPATNAISLAVHPSGDYLYVVKTTPDVVSSYRIEPDGDLTALSPASVPAGPEPTAITVDPTGRFAFVTNYDASLLDQESISQYLIENDGSLTPMSPPEVVFPDMWDPVYAAVDPAGLHAYAVGLTQAEILQFSIGAGGALMPMSPPQVAANVAAQTYAVVDPTGRYLYVTSNALGDNSILQYRIGADGTLSPMSPPEVALGSTAPGSLTVDPTGRYLYADYVLNEMLQFEITADGTLAALIPATLSSGAPGTRAIYSHADPSGRHVYVTNADTFFTRASISVFTIGANGQLTDRASVPARSVLESSPRNLPFAMSEGEPARAVPKYAYVANYIGLNISQYTIAADGSLTPLSPPEVFAGANPRSIAVDPTGSFAYVANSASNLVGQFSIGDDGQLNPLSPASVTAGNDPRFVAVYPTGEYVFVVNENNVVPAENGDVSQYTVDNDGKLTPLTPPTVAAGMQPEGFTVDPSGQYAYLANRGDDTVSQFDIHVSDGLVPMSSPTVATGSSPRSVTVHPSARFAYVPDWGDNTVSQYSLGSDGSLTPMTTATVAAGGGPISIAITPSGKYAYVANQGGTAGSVSQYIIASDGSLTPMMPAEIAAGASPLSIAVDISGRFVYVTNYQDNSVSQYSIGADGRLSPLGNPIVPVGIGPGNSRPYSIATTGTRE